MLVAGESSHVTRTRKGQLFVCTLTYILVWCEKEVEVCKRISNLSFIDHSSPLHNQWALNRIFNMLCTWKHSSQETSCVVGKKGYY